jgi:iron-sulfur cluster repair protein YtfE (RIC family)
MDAITLLEKDHIKVRGLFRKFEALTDRAHVTKQRLADQIRAELMVHTAIEEEIFYPGVERHAEEMIAEAIEEHNVVDRLLLEIRDLSPDDDQFTAKMTVMMENVEHHAEEEEKELFPTVKRAMGMDAMRALGERMARRKSELTRDQRMQHAA